MLGFSQNRSAIINGLFGGKTPDHVSFEISGSLKKQHSVKSCKWLAQVTLGLPRDASSAHNVI